MHMRPKLSKPLLTYALVQLKFTSIEDIEKYVPKLQDKIRDLFPHYQFSNIQALQLKEVQQLSPATLKQWHFIDKNKETAIITDKQTIIIHATCYDRFQSLLEKFAGMLSKFHELLKFSLFTRLGLRYINFIKEV